MDILGTMTAQICREAGARPLTPAARLAACAPVRRLAVKAGPSEIWDDLPPALETDPPVLLTYRIQIQNSNGRSAGDSTAAAYAAAGAAPPSIEELHATVSEAGAVIEWQKTPGGLTVDLKRIDLTAPEISKKRAKPAPVPSMHKGKPKQPPKSTAQPENEVHLRAIESSDTAKPAGTVDTTAQMGDTYTYVAERARPVTIGSHQLEIHSEPSVTVSVVMRDTFPPKIPAGLATIPGVSTSAGAEPFIDLSWEPNGEVDLAGYLVYRQLARPNGDPQGPLARLTPVPIAAPAYRDVAVKAGQSYIYSITAVDASGNESAPSAKALERVPSPP